MGLSTPAAPTVPTPPPTPPNPAELMGQEAALKQRQKMGQGAGFAGTIDSTPVGAPMPPTAGKSLLGG